MGLIWKMLGIGSSVEKIGGAVERVAEVFTPNRTKSEANFYRRGQASLDQLAAEFKLAPTGHFDGFVSGLNRLPRPVLALGTVGLFVYAMADPVGFSVRMRGLDTVPDQLWWLLGAIVSFYFGARELHYRRKTKISGLLQTRPVEYLSQQQNTGNAALDEWHNIGR